MKMRTYSEQLEAARKSIIRNALKRHEGNKTHAAWALRIDRNYINRLVKKYGLEAN
jgi:transcriptional regulator with PAS, ATPase and Fis domain